MISLLPFQLSNRIISCLTRVTHTHTHTSSWDSTPNSVFICLSLPLSPYIYNSLFLCRPRSATTFAICASLLLNRKLMLLLLLFLMLLLLMLLLLLFLLLLWLLLLLLWLAWVLNIVINARQHPAAACACHHNGAWESHCLGGHEGKRRGGKASQMGFGMGTGMCPVRISVPGLTFKSCPRALPSLMMSVKKQLLRLIDIHGGSCHAHGHVRMSVTKCYIFY